MIAAVAAASGVVYTGFSLAATRAQNDTAKEVQLTDRFTKAVDQLDRAGPEHLQARLGAIYALERLMRDSPRDQWTIVKVLAAFVRTTSPRPKAGSNTSEGACPREITADIQATLDVISFRDQGNDTLGFQLARSRSGASCIPDNRVGYMLLATGGRTLHGGHGKLVDDLASTPTYRLSTPWTAPGWLEALIPGRVRGYGTTEEVLV